MYFDSYLAQRLAEERMNASRIDCGRPSSTG